MNLTKLKLRVFGGLSCCARVLKEPLRRQGASSSATELLSLGTSAAGSVGGFGLSSVKWKLIRMKWMENNDNTRHNRHAWIFILLP